MTYSVTPLADTQIGLLETSQWEKQRKLYKEAKNSFKNNKLRRYQKIKQQLKHYPLYSYLEYYELNKQIIQLPYQRIDQFLQQNPHSYLADRLLTRLLTHLASIHHWKTYKRYYQPHLKKAKLQCLYIRSLMRTGETFPVEHAKSLWLSGKSQPDECDPVFAVLSQKKYLTPDLMWQRHKLAMNHRNYRLARYLRYKMKGKIQRLANLHAQIHQNPEQVKIIKSFNPSPQKVADIVYHGLYRYARHNPEETIRLLTHFKKIYPFKQEQLNHLNNRVAIQLVKDNKLLLASHIISTINIADRGKSATHLLRALLKNQQWDQINRWVNQLPTELAQSDRWQYWEARSLEALESVQSFKHKESFKHKDKNSRQIYTQLSKKRSFYGFLAADKQQQSYFFEDKPANVNIDMITRVKNIPSIQRARELFLLGSLHLARKEWAHTVKTFNEQELIAAGQLSYLWGWHRKSIEVMATARYWDDLTIRFPIVHENIIRKNAKQRNISSSLIFAIARQESAWEFDAQSRVGAKGLMQLMPATARETAKKSGLAYSKRKLFDPSYNIALGSRYISDLLKHYNNNRPLAITAYNAGPHRVKRWLANIQTQLPTDIWIEIIPFNETRKYVQNVLSYEVIYNYRRGQQKQLLTLAETGTPLYKSTLIP
ncbi:hypothetical protein AB835_02690 [Candidatus Endobugula sertula]|uniref:Lytic murein transglycosylase n=1 Tax=Candidatus Endobugula sertula TaxID=62101 RepID=A0A1D2QST6_9GAMM|nr:hypothetical protein AB835_02690 [Candidatus Endobugula sertula]